MATIRTELTVRLYKHDFGWEQNERWNNMHPNIALDSGKKNIKKLIIQSRIYVSTYNATTFLESLAMNIPSVIFLESKPLGIERFCTALL